jgi:predicted anti-sigma-YlaC factor YlaD
MSDQDQHPDLAELEALRTGEAAAETERHVRDCAECRALLEELGALGARVAAAAAPRAGLLPPEADRAVLAGIAGRAAQIRARRRPRLGWAAAAAAAAALLAAGLWASSRPASDGPRLGATADIVDAYLMDRALRAGRPAPRAWDLNRDGRVDRLDVEALARKAVRVSREGA